ncbi:MAG TPA: BrnA antitoxin family protein [Hyphomicrobiales bacterium]|nr:BrnA antitoxin family protein [Hyphomicrobiales bacterium]
MAKIDAHEIQPEEYEIPELTEEERARAVFMRGGVPIFDEEAREAFLPALRRGRPRSAAPKEAINIRLSPEVLAHFRAGGRGWQTRIDAALKKPVAKKRV